MDRFSSSIAIGIRELFRILIPGLLVVGYVRFEFPGVLSPWNGGGSIWYILILAFFVGLLIYALQLHKHLPPWSDTYHKQIDRLTSEVRVALGGAPPLIVKDYQAEYYQFLHTKVDHSFTERVHYYTSFYYLLVEISQLFAFFALVEIALVVLAYPRFAGTFAFDVVGTWPWHIGAVVVFSCLAVLFHKFAKSQLSRSIDEQIMMVKVNRSEFESMQKNLGSEDIIEILKKSCEALLSETVLDPNKGGYKIECKKQPIQYWRTGVITDFYIVKIYTAYPLTIGGEPGGYKGFYKERIEAILNHIASIYQANLCPTKVALEIIPTKTKKDYLESLVTINNALNKIITKGSPVLALAKKYNIKHVLLRGRHLVGPNPGLVQVVETICKQDILESALELFAGTCVTSKFLQTKGVKKIICVDNGINFDTAKKTLGKKRGLRCVKEDAFHFKINKIFDLIVADPYYEDAIDFLKVKMPEIYSNSRIFVFVSGGVEHEYHRDQCIELIKSYFGKEPEEKRVYGQSILICRK